MCLCTIVSQTLNIFLIVSRDMISKELQSGPAKALIQTSTLAAVEVITAKFDDLFGVSF